MPQSDGPERYILGAFGAVGVGMSLLVAGAAVVFAVVLRSLFLSGIAVALAGRAYRSIALFRGRRNETFESGLPRLFRNVGISYLAGAALCILSTLIGEGMAGVFAGLLMAAAGTVWLASGSSSGGIREWPSRWVP